MVHNGGKRSYDVGPCTNKRPGAVAIFPIWMYEINFRGIWENFHLACKVQLQATQNVFTW